MATHSYSSGSAPQSSALPFAGSSALNSDFASLEQHMHHCANAQGPLARLQNTLRTTHSLVSPRIVTLLAGTTLMAMVATSLVLGVIDIL